MLVVATDVVTVRSFLIPHIARMRERGFSVDVAARGAAGDAEVRGAADVVFEVPFSRSIGDVRSLVRGYFGIRKILRAGDYRMVHLHTPIASFVTRLAVRRMEANAPKVLYTAHGFHMHPLGGRIVNGIYLFLERMAGRWTDGLVVMNGADEALARECEIVPGERLFWCPGIGVDIEGIRRRADGGPGGAVRVGELEGAKAVFLQAAEFIPRKRHRDSVDALAHLGDPGVHLLFAGDGPGLEGMRGYVKKRRVEGQVHFLGYRTDIPELCRACDAMLLPSVREGLPRSVMEAMALGVPVLGCKIRGMVDLIDESRGRLVEPMDAEALGEAMGELANSPELRARMGENCARFVEMFSEEKVLMRYDAIYDAVLGGE